MTISKICLLFLCLLTVRSAGTPQSEGATFVMKKLIVKSPKFGKHIILYDDKDHKLISKHKWHIYLDKNSYYAVTHVYKKRKQTTVSMHRLIMGFPKNMIDHKDGNGLNNQKSNLRECTNSQNIMNGKKRLNNTSGYKGVMYRSDLTYKFMAVIGFNNQHIYLGCFKTAVKAAHAYNSAALKYHGKFARLNKI